MNRKLAIALLIFLIVVIIIAVAIIGGLILMAKEDAEVYNSLPSIGSFKSNL
jgi:flagellar basal body-associated protein FliL